MLPKQSGQQVEIVIHQILLPPCYQLRTDTVRIRYGYGTDTLQRSDTVIRYGTGFFKNPYVRIERITLKANII
jgi:hypothetical protein